MSDSQYISTIISARSVLSNTSVITSLGVFVRGPSETTISYPRPCLHCGAKLCAGDLWLKGVKHKTAGSTMLVRLSHDHCRLHCDHCSLHINPFWLFSGMRGSDIVRSVVRSCDLSVCLAIMISSGLRARTNCGISHSHFAQFKA